MEYGIVIARGIQRLRRVLPERLTAETLPELVREVVEELRERLLELDRRIAEYDRRIEQLARQNEAACRLMQVEGVGPITATAVVATRGEGHAVQHGRQFAAWVGLVPRQHATGGKPVLGRITKHGKVKSPDSCKSQAADAALRRGWGSVVGGEEGTACSSSLRLLRKRRIWGCSPSLKPFWPQRALTRSRTAKTSFPQPPSAPNWGRPLGRRRSSSTARSARWEGRTYA